MPNLIVADSFRRPNDAGITFRASGFKIWASRAVGNQGINTDVQGRSTMAMDMLLGMS